MRAIDAILFVLLLVGNVLGLPIWWWLFGTPVMRFWRWYRANNAPWGLWQKTKPTQREGH